jgi:CheY-like chemotaxis protein
MDPLPRVSLRVLLIEDNPVDVELIRIAFESENGWHPAVTVAEDGERAICLLAEGFALGQVPDFIVLDLNLPKRDGTEVLRWIRTTEGFQEIPVAILSSSPTDVIRNKLVGARVEANCYFMKPMDIDDFLGLGRKLLFCYQKSRAATA